MGYQNDDNSFCLGGGHGELIRDASTAALAALAALAAPCLSSSTVPVHRYPCSCCSISYASSFHLLFSTLPPSFFHPPTFFLPPSLPPSLLLVLTRLSFGSSSRADGRATSRDTWCSASSGLPALRSVSSRGWMNTTTMCLHRRGLSMDLVPPRRRRRLGTTGF